MANTPITCTPETIQSEYKCLPCASEDQLWKFLAWILISGVGLSWASDRDAILQKASCFDCHFPGDKQKLEAAIKVLGATMVANFDVASFFSDVACMDCLTPGQTKGMIVWLLCEYMDDILGPCLESQL